MLDRAGLAARVGDARRGRGLRAGGGGRAVRDPGRARRARHERGPLAAVVGAPGEPVGAAVGARVAQARWSRCCSRRSRCCCCPRPRWRSTPARRTSQNLPPDDAVAQELRGTSSAIAAPAGRRRSRSTSRREGPITTEARLRRLKQFQQQVARAAGHRGGAGTGLAARAHRGAAQPHPSDRLGRAAAEPPRARARAPAVRAPGRLDRGLERGRGGRRRAQQRPRPGGGRAPARSRAARARPCRRPSASPTACAQTKAGSQRLEAGSPARERAARASCRTRSTSSRA